MVVIVMLNKMSNQRACILMKDIAHIKHFIKGGLFWILLFGMLVDHVQN